MAGKEDAPSKANGVSKSEEKGKGKAEDIKDVKSDADMKDIEGEKKDEKKLLPPGSYACVSMANYIILTLCLQRSSAKKTRSSRMIWICWLSGYWYVATCVG
jgi:hypothetical protein